MSKFVFADWYLDKMRIHSDRYEENVAIGNSYDTECQVVIGTHNDLYFIIPNDHILENVITIRFYGGDVFGKEISKVRNNIISVYDDELVKKIQNSKSMIIFLLLENNEWYIACFDNKEARSVIEQLNGGVVDENKDN